MKKIIVAFDGLKYSQSSAEYALYLGAKYGAAIVGVFLEDLTYHSYTITDLVGEQHVDEEKVQYLERRDVEAREKSINSFDSKCRDAGIVHFIHRDRNIAIQELLHESLYADLIIVQGDETLTHYSENLPTHFITDLLERSKCPVIIVPSHFRQPEKFILLYDGEPASIFAMRQFGNLFDDVFTPVEIVYVTKADGDVAIPDLMLLREWLKMHFPQATFHVLNGDPYQEIVNYLKGQVQNPFVVLGAYSRGGLSRFVHRSLADLIMTKVQAPMFISHK
jgi:nucleotide-binding universal stress UspA family protein